MKNQRNSAYSLYVGNKQGYLKVTVKKKPEFGK
jgi:hypothetical protein